MLRWLNEPDTALLSDEGYQKLDLIGKKKAVLYHTLPLIVDDYLGKEEWCFKAKWLSEKTQEEHDMWAIPASIKFKDELQKTKEEAEFGFLEYTCNKKGIYYHSCFRKDTIERLHSIDQKDFINHIESLSTLLQSEDAISSTSKEPNIARIDLSAWSVKRIEDSFIIFDGPDAEITLFKPQIET